MIETETNSMRSNADAVYSGASISGQLSSSLDIDYYSIAATGAGTIAVNFVSPESGSSSHYFTVSILDSSGTVLASQESGGDLNFSTGVEAAGTYYLAVEDGYFHDTGEYSLTGTAATGNTSGVETETNSMRSNADAVYSGASISGQLSSSLDIDYYSIAATGAGTIAVNFVSPESGSSSHYFTVSILDSSGTVLASQESGGDLNFSTGVEAAGTYYLAVEDGYFHDTGEYSLTGTAATGNTSGVETETNSMRSNADAVYSGASISGQLSSSLDIDYYSIAATGAGTIAVNFVSPESGSSSHYFTVSILDSSGTVLASQESGGDLNFSTGVEAAGTYYLAVEDGYFHDTGEYSLTGTAATGNTSGVETETNSMRSNADAVYSGASISGQLSSSLDIDYYSIAATGAGTIAVNFVSPESGSSSHYFTVSILDSSGTVLASQESGGDLNFSTGVEAAGTYYLAVEDGYFHDTGEYSLTGTAATGNTSGVETETNSMRSNADAVYSGASISGQLSSSLDIDYYSIAATGAGTIAVNFVSPESGSSSHYFTVSILDSSGTVLASQESGGDLNFSTGVEAAGTYYLAVEDGYFHDTGEYSLTGTAATGNTSGVETETNSMRSNADAVYSGASISGQLSSSLDIDYYSIAATGAGTIAVNFVSPESGSSSHYFTVSILDSSGTVLASQESGGDLNFSTGVEAAGTYYLAVEDGYFHDTGEYSLTGTAATGNTSGVETETNSMRSNADAVYSGASISGQLSSSLDIDYYSIAATGAGTIAVNFVSPESGSSSHYFTVSILDSSGTVLASQESGGDLNFSTGVEAAGTYYLAVEDGYFHDTGEYSLTGTAATGNTSGVETETNSMRSNADAVYSGASISGQLSSSLDIDYYSIAATGAGTIAVNFVSPESGSSSHYFTVSILDSSGTVLASQESGGDLNFSTGVEAAGTYYLAVEDGYLHDTGEYQMSVSGPIASSENQFLQIVTPSIKSSLEASVDENSTTVSSVYMSSVSDVDNDVLMFDLAGTDASSFRINQVSGEIFFLNSPNFENKSTYVFDLIVTDGRYSVSEPISLSINDLNDSPVLTTSSTLGTNEDTASAVTAFSATDEDGDTLTYSFNDPAQGSITNNNDGTYTYTPDTNANGSDNFTITVNDGTVNVSQSVGVTINAVNDIPVLTTSSTISTNEDTPSAATAFSATDVDGDTLTYSFSDPAKGSITNNNDGTYTYTPDTNANGSDNFTITVNDGTVNVSQSVGVTINAVNDVPVLTTSSIISTNEDTASAAVAFSATDVDGDRLSYSFSDPSKGSTTNNNNGTYTYTPDANANGSDSFTIAVNDGAVDVLQTVNVTINTVTNIPVIHYDISGDAPQFIGLENLAVFSLGEPDFSYSYKNTSDTTDVTDLEFTGDLQNVSFKFLDTEIPLFNTSGGLPPLDTGIQRFTNSSLETTDVLWVHAHPTNSSLSFSEEADYLGSFMLLLDQELPDISNLEEFMEFVSSVGSDVVQIPDSLAYGPGNADWLFKSHPVVVSDQVRLTLGGRLLKHATIDVELDGNFSQISSETSYFDLQGSSIGTITLDPSMHTSDVDIGDVISNLRHIVGLDTLTGKKALAADVDNDTNIDISDVISQLRHIVGLEEINTFDVVNAQGNKVGNTLADQTSVELILNGDVDLSTTFNHAPILTTASSFITNEDTQSSTLQFTYTDVDGDELTYTFSNPEKGSVTHNESGTYTYMPHSNINGKDTFVITVSDGIADVSKTVNVTINAVNDAPSMNASVFLPSQYEDTVFELSLSDILANFSDPEGDDITLQNIRSSDAVVSTSAEDKISIDTHANFTGNLILEFEVVDDGGSSLASNAVISILDKPDLHIAIFDDFGSAAVSWQNVSLFDYTADYTSGWETSYAVDSLDQLSDLSLPSNVSTDDLKGFGAYWIMEDQGNGMVFDIGQVINEFVTINKGANLINGEGDVPGIDTEDNDPNNDYIYYGADTGEYYFINDLDGLDIVPWISQAEERGIYLSHYGRFDDLDGDTPYFALQTDLISSVKDNDPEYDYYFFNWEDQTDVISETEEFYFVTDLSAWANEYGTGDLEHGDVVISEFMHQISSDDRDDIKLILVDILNDDLVRTTAFGSAKSSNDTTFLFTDVGLQNLYSEISSSINVHPEDILLGNMSLGGGGRGDTINAINSNGTLVFASLPNDDIYGHRYWDTSYSKSTATSADVTVDVAGTETDRTVLEAAKHFADVFRSNTAETAAGWFGTSFATPEALGDLVSDIMSMDIIEYDTVLGDDVLTVAEALDILDTSSAVV
jgi:VCBS repeat-containing protein